MEVRKFDKIEVPLLDSYKKPEESFLTLAGSTVICDTPPQGIMGIAMSDAAKGDLVTVALNGMFQVGSCCL